MLEVTKCVFLGRIWQYWFIIICLPFKGGGSDLFVFSITLCPLAAEFLVCVILFSALVLRLSQKIS